MPTKKTWIFAIQTWWQSTSLPPTFATVRLFFSASVPLIKPQPQLRLINLTRFHILHFLPPGVLAKLITEIVPGVKIVDVCRSGDNQIEGALLPLFSKAKLPKGIAFPTCLSVNNCIAHFSPLSIDTTTINAGDLVKM
jgi:hypothetical protein